jgi:hypothetical protein
MAQHALRSDSQEGVLAGLSPLERQLSERHLAQLRTLAITRVDCFVETAKPWALELNTTIPAMPAYSDIAARTLIEGIGAVARLDPHETAALVQRNGSNVSALRAALVAGHRQLQGERPLRRLAILCRRQDPQFPELLYCAARFAEAGLPTDVVHPDELRDGPRPTARGQVYDVIYRHLFVRRLEENPYPDVLAMYERAPNLGEAVLLNPPSTVLEVKTTFALLSEAAEDTALAEAAGLSSEERATVAEHVPWTRFLKAPELVQRVALEPDRFVLKRAWDYGGRAVFVGAARHESSFRERTLAAFGASLDWPELCRRAAADAVGGGFVVQERVATRPERHIICTAEGPQEMDLYVDYSAYASVGLGEEPAWGGVCRGSPSQVVNIVGGGGVLPLLTEEVADGLLAALSRT